MTLEGMMVEAGMTGPDDPTGFMDRFVAIVGREGIRAPADLAGFDPGIDPANLDAGLQISPKSTREIADVLATCNQHGISVVPHGGLTGLSGAATTTRSQVIISTARLVSPPDVDPKGATVLVDAGVTLDQLNATAEPYGLVAGIDIGARGTATIGGMIATNAGGGDAFRHGVMRQQILGLEVVTADGTVMSDLKRVTKANEGLDIKQLFIGSEGTLGVISRAVLQLQPRRGELSTALVGCDSAAQALKLYERLKASQTSYLTRAEIMWRAYASVTAQDLGLSQLLSFADCPAYVIFEAAGSSPTDCPGNFEDDLAVAMDAVGLSEAILAQSDRERDDIWRIREDSWGVQRQYPGGLWFDVSVPHAHIDVYLEQVAQRLKFLDPALQMYVMGHLGDGNLHFTITKGLPIDAQYPGISAAIYDGLHEMGGSFSAEHGIGREKKSALAERCDPGKLRMMHAVKAALDPNGIMNPGKVFS